MSTLSVDGRARRLRDLHAAPEILRVVNVWDVISAKAVLALPETRAIATAGHSIAASFGYDDGSIPLETTLDMVGRIVAAAGDVPVSADLDDGYADTADTVRRAIGVGIAGANMEDRLRPFDESVARVAAAVHVRRDDDEAQRESVDQRPGDGEAEAGHLDDPSLPCVTALNGQEHAHHGRDDPDHAHTDPHPHEPAQKGAGGRRSHDRVDDQPDRDSRFSRHPRPMSSG